MTTTTAWQQTWLDLGTCISSLETHREFGLGPGCAKRGLSRLEDHGGGGGLGGVGRKTTAERRVVEVVETKGFGGQVGSTGVFGM